MHWQKHNFSPRTLWFLLLKHAGGGFFIDAWRWSLASICVTFYCFKKLDQLHTNVMWRTMSFKEPNATSPWYQKVSEQSVYVYLTIHDACKTLQGWCPESVWSCCGLNRSIQCLGRWRRRWWWWWGMWSITRGAVVHQHKAGNHSNNDDASNTLTLRETESSLLRKFQDSP